METSNITTPAQLGNTLKKLFKEKYGVEISSRYVKTVRGLEGSYYEISTFRSGHTIPNEVRKELLEISRGKPIEELGVQNPNDIYYGTIRNQNIAVYGRDWKKWLEKQ